jgi:hypothetical protein
MRNLWKICLASALVSSSWASLAQAPAAAPAAPAAKTAPMPAKPAAEPQQRLRAAMQTFVCKDGTTMSAASSKGACSGRKGIDQQATANDDQPHARQAGRAAPPCSCWRRCRQGLGQ